MQFLETSTTKNNNFYYEAFKWFGTITGAGGAIVLALNLTVSGYGFIANLISSLIWTVIGLRIKDYSLAMMNFVFVLIDILGIYRWLF